MGKSLYIIDGHAHIYAAYYAPMRQRLTSPAGEPTKAVYIFTTAVLGMIERNQPDMLVVVMDSKEPSFRREIYPEYKAHRPPMPDDMPAQIDRIEQILAAMRIPVLRLAGFEADDLIGTIAKQAEAKKISTYICSKDKDMLQLLNKYVSTFDMKTGEIFDVSAMAEKIKVRPEQFIDCLALQGDTADNIPGVPDVGPKTALEWIQQYGTLENLFAHADEIKGKRGESLRNSKEVVCLSRKLVTIDCEAPVKFNDDVFSRKDIDKDKLGEIFSELGFSRLISQLGLGQASSKSETKIPDVRQTGGVLSAGTVDHKYILVDTMEKFREFFSLLKRERIFAFDTETTSIFPMRADLVGMSFCWREHEAYYLPVQGPMGSKYLNLSEVRQKLAPIFADEKVKKIGQNIKYDMIVMSGAGMPVQGVYFDTMIASYVLDASRRSHSMDAMAMDFLNYECIGISSLIGRGKDQLTFDMVDIKAAAEYSAEDADVTFMLYRVLNSRLEKEPRLKKLFEQIEMPLVGVLAVMEVNGVSLDVPLLKNMSHTLSETVEGLASQIYEYAGEVFNIDSTKQLAEVLFDRLGLPSVREGKTGRSTDAAVLEELSSAHAIVPLILQYRQIVKLKNTYIDKLGTLINPRTGRVHASFNQTITATGRLSSSDPNLQNIPVRTDLGKKIRSAFVPAKRSDVILSADYSQIELRLLAHFSQDKALREAFEKNQDIHRFVAAQIYNVPLEEVTSQMRSHCKAVNFGIIYGQGAFGLSRTTGLSQSEAKKFIEDYFTRYASIRKFMDDAVAGAKTTGHAETIMGRRRIITGLSARNFNTRSQAERLVINTIIQGSAADMIKLAMINIQRVIERDNLPVKMILQIHDELVFEVPRDKAVEYGKWIAAEMTGAIRLSVPLKVDISYGRTWMTE
ncbi:MAG: DNA polymerase I [Planctomycetota bacterium]